MKKFEDERMNNNQMDALTDRLANIWRKYGKVPVIGHVLAYSTALKWGICQK